MSMLLEALLCLLLLVGCGFTLLGAVGLVKLSDFFRRIHAPAKASTLGVGCILFASMIYHAIYGAGLHPRVDCTHQRAPDVTRGIIIDARSSLAAKPVHICGTCPKIGRAGFNQMTCSPAGFGFGRMEARCSSSHLSTSSAACCSAMRRPGELASARAPSVSISHAT